MDGLALLDDLFAAFASSLPEHLAGAAAALPRPLGLAPAPGVRWSEVFGHEVTLAAPALFADAMTQVPAPCVMDAVLAHMLAVIEAFGTDRVQDGQVQATPELEELLAHLRIARDQALARIAPDTSDGAIDGRRADAETLGAIAEEREALLSGEALSMTEYERISLGKQAVGFPATLALAHAAGWDVRRRRAAERTLAAVWIGLQIHDDVVDWEDDLARGGAWAVALARGARQNSPPSERKTAPPLTRRWVHSSGVLAEMLERSRRSFRAARRRARVLGAHRLAAWAGEREAYLAELTQNEKKSAGFANRAHALAAWAREVLG